MQTYQLLFGHVAPLDVEADYRKRRAERPSATIELTVRVPEILGGELKAAAARAGVTAEAWIVAAIARTVEMDNGAA